MTPATVFGWSRIYKLILTIADLVGAKDIADEHIAEAISYCKLDRKL
jgi:predicted ATPase with chaperone activity